MVNGQHGTVRKINARATQIDTFDRSTLVVPNSELVSTTVENWTHHSNIGRVTIPVGVAYGTAPEKVQEILLEVARSTEGILPRPQPVALFRGFGESALNFAVTSVM